MTFVGETAGAAAATDALQQDAIGGVPGCGDGSTLLHRHRAATAAGAAGPPAAPGQDAAAAAGPPPLPTAGVLDQKAERAEAPPMLSAAMPVDPAPAVAMVP